MWRMQSEVVQLVHEIRRIESANEALLAQY